ncbi:hypothetical protein [Nostoc favosum]|uniref:Uncharacterized protein n=1 Tax=Nostoc favosum CHAB5714 TaxID=2780399 RepID=A0ABS8I2Y6_9NOSO|nr:hypothetical protein [Nostoc favosum]MCC5597959.1 hypothetical protein [Nostoc favosum CHAB5714]
MFYEGDRSCLGLLPFYLEPLTLRRYDLRVNAVVGCQFPLAGLWYLLSAGRLLSLPGLG